MRDPGSSCLQAIFLAALAALTLRLPTAGSCFAADLPDASRPGAAVTVTQSAAEFSQLEAADDAAQTEVDQWVRENKRLRAQGAGVPDGELEQRIGRRFEPVRQAYEQFVGRHPDDARAHLVFGSFLNDRQDEHGAQVQWEQALQLDPTNPVVYNNLAGRYAESGPVNKAFEYFTKAIELKPSEPAYYHNFADSLYVLRKRAAAFYGITEQGVYAKVLLLYSNAAWLAPTNFAFARDLAQTYYSVKPLPIQATLRAWTNALSSASEGADREEVYVHLARVKMLAGRYAEARAQLASVTNPAWLPAKAGLLRNLAEREKSQQ